jgi:glucose/arabinose dehydrogenase
LGDDAEQGTVIFSNSGANQTLDLDFAQASLCYNNGAWLTLEQCGVPTQNALDVGGDRKVDRGSKIVLTLPENDLSGEVTWQSDTWSGVLTGEPVDPNDPRKNNSAQETDNLRGTFIRVEMLNTPENNLYYRVPNDNPFLGNTAFRDEIWSFGHYNPWRWSFQTTFPYTLWQTEVGQAGFEEVNIIEPGKNYGSPICEGVNHRGQAGGDPQVKCSCTGDLEGPVEGYSDEICSVSIIGGFVYNGNALPALRGKFLFGDYIGKNIWSIEKGQNKTLLSDGFPSNIVSFGSNLSGD